jgi:hypothetical protein
MTAAASLQSVWDQLDFLVEPLNTAAFNQNPYRAFVLFELTPANELSLVDLYKKALGKCCIDAL